MNEIRLAIDQAYQGIIPSLEDNLPSFVNHNFVLAIMEQIYIITLTIAHAKVQEYKSKGNKIDLRDKMFIEVEIDIENNIEIEKQEIFKKFGLLHFEDSPSLIVHKAIEKYSSESLVFARKLREIENEYKENVELIMKDEMPFGRFQNIIQKNR